MGGILSDLSSSTRNPSDAETVPSSSSTSPVNGDLHIPKKSPISANPMSASDSQPPKPDPNSPENQAPLEQSDAPIDSKVEALSPDQSGSVPFNGGEGGGEGDQEDEEEQGECGFCLFMKGGGCRDNFIDWEKCIEEGEKNNEDIVEKCAEITKALRDCMFVHADYYEPILRAEKVAEQEVFDELEKEAAAKRSEQSTDQNSSDPNQSQKDSGNKRASNDK